MLENSAMTHTRAWLKVNIDPLLQSPMFQPGGDGLLIITFDESANDNTNCGGQVLWLGISPKFKAQYRTSFISIRACCPW